LHADDGTDLVAVHVRVAGMHALADELRRLIDTAVHA
jgi:hypothetical protein